ncbi:MAG: peptidoglycan-binding protein [Cyanobacteria bacterium CRU_2_1]|nr:peptidoglycan-binding protein [Cyanobacteria bacterium CRU_2_1]
MSSVPQKFPLIIVLSHYNGEQPILQMGDTGATVVELQKLLVRRKFFTNYFPKAQALIGQFDETVKSAVEDFQAAMFLPITGGVDSLTWQVLHAGAPIHMPVLRLGSGEDSVKLLQQILLKTGDYLPTSSIDNTFGSITEWAVRHFQRRVGLSVDGIVTVSTWYSLSKALILATNQRLPRVRGIDFSSVWYVLSENDRDRNLENAIRKVITISDERVRYYYNHIDLNQDRQSEVLVYVMGSNTELNSSLILLFQPHAQGYRFISKIGLGTTPIIVTDQVTCGWKDLIIHSTYRGESNYWYARFNGKEYIGGSYSGHQYEVPSNAAISGVALIADNFLANPGIELPKPHSKPWFS